MFGANLAYVLFETVGFSVVSTKPGNISLIIQIVQIIEIIQIKGLFCPEISRSSGGNDLGVNSRPLLVGLFLLPLSPLCTPRPPGNVLWSYEHGHA